MHSILPFLIAMVLIVVLLGMLANRLKVAYPILLVLAGLIISLVPGLPPIKVNPDLIFFILLPPLLFEASWSVSFKEMKKWWRMISSFAFLVVLFTAFSVAIVTNYFIPGFTLALGFLLGGIVSPPDAVSIGAITKFVKIPRSTSAVLEGESLLNDASSLIIFRFALITVGTGQFIWHQAALSFVWMVIGGVGTGLALAWLFVQGHRRLPTDAPSDIALTLIEPYILYWVAEQLHSSGVLAVVSGGLFMAHRRLFFLSSTSRIRGYSVWESFTFLLNGVVFLIIGLDLPEIVDGLRSKGIPLRTAIGYSLLVTAVLIVARIISSYVALIATLIFRPNVAPRPISRLGRFTMPLLLGWTGMRGVVSLAAALSIPVSLSDGTAFPYRNLILFITFVVILLTLVVQGLTLPYLLNRAQVLRGLQGEPPEAAKQKLVRDLRLHTYAFLKERYDNELHDHAGMRQLLQHWEDKMKAADEDWMNHKTKIIFLEMLECQRQYIAELNNDPNVDEDLVREQLFLIDLEEERIRMALK
ncbi:Na+/H+ antiporter [Taibaiella koreensis]|uniref:Na+/H+ antiporter n=1 Tax=Taibaiella koreensis TaxID=1268548 RepID=UPI000E59C5DC|nr:Na+/H+ antiporter [Taibaiella koreensis]